MTWTVADVMTREVVTVSPTESFKTCADLMRIHGISALPVVVAGSRVAGLISEADLMRPLAAIPDIPGETSTPIRKGITAAEIMTPEVVTIAPGASVTAAARLMSEHRVKRLPVVDSSHRLVGIVSRGDVLRIFLRSDESIRKEVANGLLNELPLLGRGRIQVAVRDGVVQLHGEVESGSLTGLLLRLIAAVPGVVGIENRLQVTSAVVEAEPAGHRSGSAARG
jgi:CBS domain-containing protein